MTHLRLAATTTFDSGIVVHTYNPKIDRRDESEGKALRFGSAAQSLGPGQACSFSTPRRSLYSSTEISPRAYLSARTSSAE